MQNLQLSEMEQRDVSLDAMFQQREKVVESLQAVQVKLAKLEEQYSSIDGRDMQYLEKL